jgi:hypothetical protein
MGNARQALLYQERKNVVLLEDSQVSTTCHSEKGEVKLKREVLEIMAN